MKHLALGILLTLPFAASITCGVCAGESCCVSVPPQTPAAVPVGEATQATASLPRLVDLGADKCIPCKMMAPILDELAAEYKGQMEVVFIDVWKNREEGERYNIRSIPTQIFYAADGRELYRHTGFYPKADILAKWKELGVELKAPAKAAE
ncbi:MAG TPA: thioredoxin family protein [Opitutales bacterium]|nr:thioredoxin family protein [Opitutales bacterium]